MARKIEAEIQITESSGNIFADIGLPEPEEELAKAQLASRIRQVIRGKRLTQGAAASRMGVDQPKVSAIINGRTANFSSDRLMRWLTMLGQDVEINVKPARYSIGHIFVTPAMGARSSGAMATARRASARRAAASSTKRRAARRAH
jgi:predicted XRE-type DNA-binding protein